MEKTLLRGGTRTSTRSTPRLWFYATEHLPLHVQEHPYPTFRQRSPTPRTRPLSTAPRAVYRPFMVVPNETLRCLQRPQKRSRVVPPSQKGSYLCRDQTNSRLGFFFIYHPANVPHYNQQRHQQNDVKQPKVKNYENVHPKKQKQEERYFSADSFCPRLCFDFQDPSLTPMTTCHTRACVAHFTRSA